MRCLLINPLILLLTAAAGCALCAAAGHAVDVRIVAMAAAVFFVAAELACLPLILTRGASQIAVVQAALAGSGVHLMAGIFGSGMVFFTAHPSMSFIYWLFAMYIASLAVLVIEFSRAIRAATPARLTTPAADNIKP